MRIALILLIVVNALIWVWLKYGDSTSADRANPLDRLPQIEVASNQNAGPVPSPPQQRVQHLEREQVTPPPQVNRPNPRFRPPSVPPQSPAAAPSDPPARALFPPGNAASESEEDPGANIGSVRPAVRTPALAPKAPAVRPAAPEREPQRHAQRPAPPINRPINQPTNQSSGQDLHPAPQQNARQPAPPPSAVGGSGNSRGVDLNMATNQTAAQAAGQVAGQTNAQVSSPAGKQDGARPLFGGGSAVTSTSNQPRQPAPPPRARTSTSPGPSPSRPAAPAVASSQQPAAPASNPRPVVQPSARETGQPASGKQDGARPLFGGSAASTSAPTPAQSRSPQPAAPPRASTGRSAPAVASSQQAVPPATKIAEPVPDPVCLEWGPWTSNKESQDLVSRLGAAGIQMSEQKTQTEVSRGTWLFYPAETREQGKSIGAALNAAGVRDWAILTSKESPFVVSVGMFSTKEGLQARQKLIAAVPHQAVAKPQLKTVSANFLIAKIQPGKDELPSPLPPAAMVPCSRFNSN